MSAERIQHDLVQNTPAWAAFRLEHDGASEAAAMLGLSSYVTRTELLHQKATGIAPEVDENKLWLFAAGHAAEAAARPLAEAVLVDELYPAVFSFGRLSASLDGLTMDGMSNWQHKLWNASLAEAVERFELPDEYQAQVQQEMLVSGAEQTLFMVSDGTSENCVHMFVRPDRKWFKCIEDGWKQFNADLAEYKPVEVIPAAVAAPTMALPALSIQVQIEQDEKTKKGSITVIDNLKVFGERLEFFISGLDLKPATDQAFADAEAAIKTLGTAETALEAAKASGLAQVASVEEMTRTVALYAAQARNCRLMLTKLVKDRKESIRVEIVTAGFDVFAAHVATLNKRLGKPYLVPARPDLNAAIKGRKSVASLRDAVDSAVATAKIEASATADKIQINLAALYEIAKDHPFLFADKAELILKDTEYVEAIARSRIAEHTAAEAKRIEAEAEKARERIRAEESAKLLREQQDRERRERIEAEQAKEQAAARGSGEAAQNGNSVARDAKPAESTAIQYPAPAAARIRPATDDLVRAVSHVFTVSHDQARRWLVEAFSRQ